MGNLSSNLQTAVVQSDLLRNKLGQAVLKLQAAASANGTNVALPTLESVLNEATKILSQFFKQLSEPSYKPVEVAVDSPPNFEDFNQNANGIADDLHVIFDEFENLESVILGNFNYMISKINNLNGKLKGISSSLGDFILYSNSTTKDAIFFADSFSNLSRIEINSPLLNKEQCEVDQVEGIVTLPINRGAQVPIIIKELPVINSSSNGRLGNQEQLNAALNGDIGVILDDNADTWFEYERVVTQDDGIPLLLDMTINLGESRIINFIRINPNNFGTRTQVEILAIDSSIDGHDFVSIKDDIPIAGFIAEDEDNVFVLAPSTNKYAGQGWYSFTPRKAKYVRLALRQSTPYIITTAESIQKTRYAIGVRDIVIAALPYKNEGELISVEYPSLDEIRKVVLLSSQNPDASTTSSLVSIDHFVSPDNGITWQQIRAINSDGLANSQQTISELIDFNGVSRDSVVTEGDVVSLRYRAVMKRNTDAFTKDNSELAQTLAFNTELHTPPTTTPFEFKLQQVPIEETIRLIDPQFGSRGKEKAKYKIATGNANKQIILLPFTPLKRDQQKIFSGGKWNLEDLDPQTVYVDGQVWLRNLSTSSISTAKSYSLNFEEARLEFGDGVVGKAVPTGATISMTLSEERLFPSRGDDHVALLDYPTSSDKKQVEISILYPSKLDTLVLKKGAKRYVLKPDIINNSLVFSDSVIFDPAEEKTFIDGSTEFTGGAGNWSVDYTNGILYSYSTTDESDDTTVTYYYYPRTIIAEDDWEFVDAEEGIGNAISINDNAYQTFVADTYTIPDSIKYFNLPDFAIVKGTVQFLDLNTEETPTALSQEIQFIDGRSELLGVIRTAEQLASITGVTPGEVRAIPFSVKISSDVGFSVTFTNTDIFKIEKGSLGAVTTPGDYYIDRAASPTGTIHIKLDDDVDEPGNVYYYYIDPQANLVGRYSINYNTGEVFTYSSTTSLDGITVDYQFTNYKIKYDVARLIPNDDWIFSDQKLTIKDTEILRNIRTPQVLGSQTVSTAKYYQVSYQYVASTRADVAELEPYFSPVLKNYALKVITQNRLINS